MEANEPVRSRALDADLCAGSSEVSTVFPHGPPQLLEVPVATIYDAWRQEGGNGTFTDREGELLEAKLSAIVMFGCEDACRGLEFAHVAGPAMEHERLDGASRDLARGCASTCEEVAQERHDIRSPLAKRRQVGRRSLEAAGEVGAEVSRRHELERSSARRRDDAYVDGGRVRRAHGSNLTLLKDTQQLDLRSEREVSDFVEQQGSVVGGADESLMLGRCPGEGTSPVAKKLALDELLRKGSAVDGDERARTTAPSVQRARGELLARARLTDEDHGDVGGRDGAKAHEGGRKRKAAEHAGGEVGDRVALSHYDRDVLADAYHRVGQKDRLGDTLSVDPHAVVATEIAQHDPPPDDVDARVPTRDAAAVKADGGVLAAADLGAMEQG